MLNHDEEIIITPDLLKEWEDQGEYKKIQNALDDKNTQLEDFVATINGLNFHLWDSCHHTWIVRLFEDHYTCYQSASFEKLCKNPRFIDSYLKLPITPHYYFYNYTLESDLIDIFKKNISAFYKYSTMYHQRDTLKAIIPNLWPLLNHKSHAYAMACFYNGSISKLRDSRYLDISSGTQENIEDYIKLFNKIIEPEYSLYDFRMLLHSNNKYSDEEILKEILNNLLSIYNRNQDMSCDIVECLIEHHNFINDRSIIKALYDFEEFHPLIIRSNSYLSPSEIQDYITYIKDNQDTVLISDFVWNKNITEPGHIEQIYDYITSRLNPKDTTEQDNHYIFNTELIPFFENKSIPSEIISKFHALVKFYFKDFYDTIYTYIKYCQNPNCPSSILIEIHSFLTYHKDKIDDFNVDQTLKNIEGHPNFRNAASAVLEKMRSNED